MNGANFTMRRSFGYARMHAVWLFLALIFLPASRAFVGALDSNGRNIRWDLVSTTLFTDNNVVNPNTRAIRYFMGAEGYSSTNRAAELDAIRVSFAQWQAIPGTILKFEEGGLLPGSVDVNTFDNTNVIFWARSTTLVNGGRDNISGATAVTFFDYFSNGAMAESDIVLNGAQFVWFTDITQESIRQFVEGPVLHEIGHFLGLNHSPVGGATMLARGATGVNAYAGLSQDEISATRALYGQTSLSATLGRIQGQVNMNGAGVFGAVIILEDSAGNVVAGALSHTNSATAATGFYELPAIPPGNYFVRVTPLDAVNTTNPLLRGRDISVVRDANFNFIYDGVQTGFLPTTNRAITVTAGQTTTLNWTLTSGTPALRISRIRPPTISSEVFTIENSPALLRPGQGNVWVGVYLPSLPADAALTITGDGLTLGAPVIRQNAFGALHAISVLINVSSNATPGLRSFVVKQGENLAYANGFLEIAPAVLDSNYDGLDDLFQRKYFARFTDASAGPGADPDSDGFSNRFEATTGSDPTNAASAQFKILSVTVARDGTRVTCQSEAGKRFQLYSRSSVGTGPWQPVGSPVTATGPTLQILDAVSTQEIRFYRVQYLP
jgi:hypothetical protein